MVDKQLCIVDGCDRLILPSTAEANDGKCMPCVQAEKAAERRAYILANRRRVDRFEGIDGRVEILRLIHDRPTPDPLIEYVPYPRRSADVYSELADDEIRSMVAFAIARLPDDPDTASEVAGALASFTDADLDELQRAFLAHAVFYPSHLFRGAAPDIREALLSRLADGDAGGEVLLALAWIGDEDVERAFAGWRDTPPDWAESLFISPHTYARYGGWELDGDGRRRELVLEPCYALVPAAESDDGTVTVVRDVDEPCGFCSRPLLRLLELDVPALPRVAITTCDACGCYATIFCNSSPDAAVAWSRHNAEPDYRPDDTVEWGRMPAGLLRRARDPRESVFGIDWCSDAVISQVGGHAAWIQDAEYPECPSCATTMVFVGQVSNEELDDQSEGIYYAFVCAACSLGATVYQQT